MVHCMLQYKPTMVCKGSNIKIKQLKIKLTSSISPVRLVRIVSTIIMSTRISAPTEPYSSCSLRSPLFLVVFV